MNFGNIIAAVGAGMAGYNRGTQQKRQNDADDSDAQHKQWQRDQVMQQAARDAALRGDLTQAGMQQTVQENAGMPDTMDNIDVGQPGEAPVQPNTYTVAGQNYTDPNAAQAAATAANTPTAQANRIAAAYSANGQPGMAAQVRSSATQQELVQLGLDQKHMDIANEQFDSHLNTLDTPDAVAAFISSTPHDGQGGALQLQAVPSQDGKTVSYAKVNDDGSLTPTGHVYTNDDAGLDQAKVWLSHNTSLIQKIGVLHQASADKLAADKEANEETHRDAQDAYWTAMAAAAGVKAEKAGTGKVPLFDRMDENDKAALTQTYKDRTEANGLINKGIAEGTIKKGDDSYNYLNAQVVASDLKSKGILAKYADDSGPASDPLGLRGSAPTGGSASMISAGTQAARDADAGKLMIDSEYGGDLGRAQTALATLRAAASGAKGDTKQIIGGEADRLQAAIAAYGKPASTQPGAAPAPVAMEPGQRRVAATPIVNFSAPVASGQSAVQKRISALQAVIPGLQANVVQARAAVMAAQSQGPMAVAAARDRLTNAQSALADANQKAGN